MAARTFSIIVITITLMTAYSSVMGFPENVLLFSNSARSGYVANPRFPDHLKPDFQEEDEEDIKCANSGLKKSLEPTSSRLVKKKGGSVLFDLVDYVNKAKPKEGEAGISSDVVAEKAPKSELWDVMSYNGK